MAVVTIYVYLSFHFTCMSEELEATRFLSALCIISTVSLIKLFII